MEIFSDINWDELFGLSTPLIELLIRGTTMFWFLFLVFRFIVRRDVGSVGIGDILVIVIVADAAQNAMSGEYISITDGFVLVLTLVGWNLVLDWLSFRFKFIRRFAEPQPLLLVKDGRLMPRNLRRELLSEEELLAKLREAGVESVEGVRKAYMESDGQISVIKRGG